MGILIPIALFGWIPFCLGLYLLLPARQACITAFILGWLFLPSASYGIPGFPDYSKITVVGLGVLIAATALDTNRVLSYRFHWIDLAIILTCTGPFFSSMFNGLGWYDGVAAAVGRFLMFGVSYFVGRIYFTDLMALRDLAVGLCIGGLVYVPLCLFEIRMSPKLHLWTYGYLTSPMIRRTMFGFRPNVFLDNSLNAGIFMATTTVVAFWLWQTKAVRYILQIPMGFVFGALYITTFLCQVLGPLMLLHGAMLVLWTSRRFNWRLPLAMMVLAAPLYIGLRSTELWTGNALVGLASQISKERADSLRFRLINENMLVDKALEQRWFGWGGWGRSRVFDEHGRDISVTDGLWVILLGQNGWYGLGTFVAALVLPGLILVRKLPSRAWAHPLIAPLAAITLVSICYMIDSLFNATFNPLASVLLGAAAAGVVALKNVVRIPAPVSAVPMKENFYARPRPAH